MVINVEVRKQNCQAYAKSHYKAKEILRYANGKRNYREIARLLKINEKTVSPLLREAEELGLARKVGRGVYKKIPGVMKYMPKKEKTKKDSLNEKAETLKRLTKKRFKSQKLNKKKSVPLGSSFNAEKMAKSYMWLYFTENALRELIRKVFENEKDYWKKRANIDIQKKVKEVMENYPYDGAVRKDELEYTHLGQLKQIIISKKNWDLFLPFLKEKNKNSFEATVDKAIPSRNSIAHCTPLKAEDFKFVEVRFKDILNMIV